MLLPPATNFYNPVDTSNPSIDYAELDPSILARTCWSNGSIPSGILSTNMGITWSYFATNPSEVANNGPGLMAVSADGSWLVWVVYGYPPFYSTDHGATWNQSGGNAMPTYSWEQPFLCSDRVNPKKFYIYMRSTGVIYVSTDGGASFSAATAITAWGQNDIHATYGQEGHVWVTTYDGLWRSTDSGASFFQVPLVQASLSVGFGRPNGGVGYPVLYMYGQVNNTWGFYRSENQGTNWTQINDDQHQFGGCEQVTGDPKIYGRCYFAAGGRGIHYGDLPGEAPGTPTGLTASSSNAAISLAWNAVVGADSYILGRSTTSGGPYTGIATGVTATTYLDTGLINGANYYYVVAATNAYGVSSNSAEASARPLIEFAGTVIGSPGSWDNLGNTITNAFDGDTNTFYDAADASGDWAGLDLGGGAAAIVMQIEYCPRASLASRMFGGQFQGANVAGFSSGVVTLFTVGGIPPDGVMTVQAITNAASFRYLRYIGPANGFCDVAEVEFLGLNAVLPPRPDGLECCPG